MAVKKRVAKKSPYLIVEVEKPRELRSPDKETASMVASLGGHPGFLYLLAKLRFQRSQLRAHLEQTKQETLSDVDFLKSGIAWTGWLEKQLEASAKIQTERPQLPPMDSEQAAFNEVYKMLESVGIPVAEQPRNSTSEIG